MRASRQGFKNRSARRLSNLVTGKNERRLTRNRDLETFRTKRAVQVMQGLSVHEVTVVGEQPYRDASGRLVWDCLCASQQHKVVIEHSDLAAGHGVCTLCQEPARRKSKGIESLEDFRSWYKSKQWNRLGAGIQKRYEMLVEKYKPAQIAATGQAEGAACTNQF